MRVLIAGGAGFIGSHAVRAFLDRGHEVHVLDNLCAGHRNAVPAEILITANLSDRKAVEQAIERTRPDAVVHFAAFIAVGESVIKPDLYYGNNVVGTFHLLEECRKAGVKRFVFSSTAAVYGDPEIVPIPETSPLRPINPYGRTKLAVEWMLEDYASAFGMSLAVMRYFNAAGAHPSGEIGEDHYPESHLIPLALFAASGRRPSIDVFGTDYPTPDGSCIRDYIHVVDLAEAHVLAVEQLAPAERLHLNLGLGRGYSVLEVIQACERVTGMKAPVRIAPRRPGDPPRLVADPARARERLNWRPRFDSLESIVETAWNWHSSHPAGYADGKPDGLPASALQ